MMTFLPVPTLYHTPHSKLCRIGPTCSTSPPSNSGSVAPKAIETLADTLRRDLPNLFSPSPTKEPSPHYAIYDPSVTFEDPLNKFTGIERYKANITFLNNSPVFSDANLTLYDTRIVDQDVIRTRWALSMTANLPWRPCIAFTGQSDYIVHPDTALVVRHVDIWDSLSRNDFFSFEAVKDLVTQCRPASVGPTALGGFQLLRRTASLQIRRYTALPTGLRLRQSSDQSLDMEKWVVDDAGEGDTAVTFIKLAAVVSIPDSSSVAALAAAKKRLKKEIDSAHYAQAGSRYFDVSFSVQGVIAHELWMELENVTSSVEL